MKKSHKLKKSHKVLLCILAALGLLYVLHQPKAVSHTVKIHDARYLSSNFHQNYSSMMLWTDDSNLYFFSESVPTFVDENRYYRWLCKFDDGAVKRIKKLGSGYVPVGLANGFFYYWKFPEDFRDPELLYSYNLSTGEEKCLYTGEFGARSFLEEDGTFYVGTIVTDKDNHEYLPVHGDLTDEVKPYCIEYQLGEYLYSVEDDSFVQTVFRTDRDGNKEELPLEYGKYRTLIPCNDGLLIHNAGQDALLYFVDREGNVKLLFRASRRSGTKSAVTVHGSKVYLSFMRFEWHDVWLAQCKDDELVGTHIIDLETFTSQKVSDKTYYGLYNFDDTCIYACDEYCHIYKLDFDGQVIETMLG